MCVCRRNCVEDESASRSRPAGAGFRAERADVWAATTTVAGSLTMIVAPQLGMGRAACNWRVLYLTTTHVHLQTRLVRFRQGCRQPINKPYQGVARPGTGSTENWRRADCASIRHANCFDDFDTADVRCALRSSAGDRPASYFKLPTIPFEPADEYISALAVCRRRTAGPSRKRLAGTARRWRRSACR